MRKNKMVPHALFRTQTEPTQTFKYRQNLVMHGQRTGKEQAKGWPSVDAWVVTVEVVHLTCSGVHGSK